MRSQPRDIYWMMIALLAVLNFVSTLFAPMVEMAWLGASFFGLLLGQWNWLAVWAVFGPTSWKARFPEVLCGMLALFLSLFAGAALHHPMAPRELAEGICLLPVAMIATQSPLWPFRLFLGWRIRPNERPADAVADEARRFDLRHLFAATAVVAASLGAARGAGVQTDTLPVMLVGLPLVTILTAVPAICTGIILADSAKANFAFAAYVFVLPGVLMAGYAVLAPVPVGGFFAEAFVSVCCFMCALAAVVHAPLRLIRAGGFAMTAPRATVRPPN